VQTFDAEVDCALYLLDRLDHVDFQWQSLKVQMKDLVFDFAQVPKYCADKHCFVRQAPMTVNACGYLLPSERLSIPLEQVLQCDHDIIRCAMDKHEALYRRRVAVYNEILAEVKAFMHKRADTLWMMIWHSSADCPYSGDLKTKAQEIKEFAAVKDEELSALFSSVETCRAFMADRNLLQLWQW
jgi:hypothetical protein